MSEHKTNVLGSKLNEAMRFCQRTSLIKMVYDAIKSWSMTNIIMTNAAECQTFRTLASSYLCSQ